MSVDGYTTSNPSAVVAKELFIANGNRWRLRMENMYGITNISTTINQYQTMWSRLYQSDN